MAVTTEIAVDPGVLGGRVAGLLDLRPEDLVLERLSGGFSRETWLARTLSADFDGGDAAGPPWIVSVERTVDGLSTREFGQSAEAQLRILRHLHERRVPVPVAVAATDEASADDPASGVGAILITGRVEGAVSPREVLRLASRLGDPVPLVASLADALGGIHGVEADSALGMRPYGGGHAWVEAALREFAAGDGDSLRCAALGGLLEAALEVEPVPTTETRLVHGDYRIGNIICAGGGGGGVCAVLDWELAHFGDPVEDLVWFRLDPWRFREGLAGGIVPDQDWLRAYEATTGRSCAPERLRYWDVIGCAKMSLLAMETLRRAGHEERQWLRQMLQQLSVRLESLLESAA